MYTPPMFKPDRAASLAFAQARGFGTVCAWDGSKPIASSLPFYLAYADDGTPHGGVSRRASQSADQTGGRDIVLADGRERRGCLCLGGLVRLAGSGADLAVSGRASDRHGAQIVRQRTRSASRCAQRQIRKLAGAETALDVVEDDGGASGCDEEGDRRSGDDGRGGRGQLQAEPAQIRRRPCGGGDGACAAPE